MKKTFREAISEWLDNHTKYRITEQIFDEDKRELQITFALYGPQDCTDFDDKMVALRYRFISKQSTVFSVKKDVLQSHVWAYPAKIKTPLIVQILELCGVQDLEGINHVKIEVSVNSFHIHIQQNAHTADRQFMVEGAAIVQQFTDFNLVEEK